MIMQLNIFTKMHSFSLFVLFLLLSNPFFTSPSPTPTPAPTSTWPGEAVDVDEVCNSDTTGNPIDDCWRKEKNWAEHRQDLSKCGLGFGENAKGGSDGSIYVVTDPTDDPQNPQKGTLRYGATQDQPLWIVFEKDMSITLEKPINIRSYKTIDGRGAEVSITSSKGTCLEITEVTNVIVHGLSVHDCYEDAVTLAKSSHVWIDHCSFSRCGDGLVDVTLGSTMVTISNSYFTDHSKVMLLGNDDQEFEDKNMRVTVAFNHFGHGAQQRLPRCRFGVFHVVNNHYTYWYEYAIGGSAAPTIYSQGNRFLNSDEASPKMVTKRMDAEEDEWKKWNWRSEGDLLLNGAEFEESGSKSSTGPYEEARSLRALDASLVPLLTRDAGVLHCQVGNCC